MKKIMNYSKLALSALVTSSLFVACSEEISENTVDTPYTANTANIHNAGQAVDLGLPSGTLWASTNVGAASETDNGILFVWGDVTGTKLMADNSTSYTDVTEQTPLADLFELYKGDEKTGKVCDTTNISKTTEPMLIDLLGVSDDQKRDEILAFVEAKLNSFKDSYAGSLEATLTNDEFECIIEWDGSKFVERLPNIKDALKLDHDAKAQDTLDYYGTFDYTKATTLVIDQIGTEENSFFESSLLKDKYTEIKDQFGAVIRKDYAGGDIGNDVKDRLDEKKKNNMTFVPVYNIIDTDKDPAAVNWGNGWQMPNTADFVELLENCDWEFEGTGYRVTSKVNDNSIFLPAAGYRYGEQQYGNGNAGYYASGEITGTYSFPSMAAQLKGSKGEINGNENMPNMLIFQHGQYNSLDLYNNLSTSFGVSVRPVKKVD